MGFGIQPPPQPEARATTEFRGLAAKSGLKFVFKTPIPKSLILGVE